MFDTIFFRPLGDYDYQTKDLECALSRYNVGQDGKLTCERDAPYGPKEGAIDCGSYTGTIDFYGNKPQTCKWVDYRATFESGKCVLLEEFHEDVWLETGSGWVKRNF